MRKYILGFAVAMAACVAGPAQAALVTGVTTDNDISDDANDGLAHVLTSITDASGTRTDLKFATGKLGDVGNNEHHGLAATAAGGALAALIDNRLDTGTLNTGNGGLAAADRFTFSDSIVATDKLFLIFNGANDNYPTEAGVFDAAGTQLGSSVAITDFPSNNLQFDRIDLQRVGAGALSQRRMYGLTVDVSAFGAPDPTLITGLGFSAVAATDYNLAGIASIAVPEPSSMALLCIAGLGMVGRRTRKKVQA